MFLLTAMSVGCGSSVRSSSRISLLLHQLECLVVVGIVLLMTSASALAAAAVAPAWSSELQQRSLPTYALLLHSLRSYQRPPPLDDFVDDDDDGDDDDDDFIALGNEKSLSGNGNALTAEMLLTSGKYALEHLADASVANDVEYPLDERRQRFWEWLLQRSIEQQQQQQFYQQQQQQQRQPGLFNDNRPRKTKLLLLEKRQKEVATMHKRARKSEDNGWQQRTELNAHSGADALVDGNERRQQEQLEPQLKDQNDATNVNDIADSAEHYIDALQKAAAKRNAFDSEPVSTDGAAFEKNSKRNKNNGRSRAYRRFTSRDRQIWKRDKASSGQHTFLPSISPGAMTHLGNFFKDLSKNVHYSENAQLRHEQSKLLEGNHPLRLLHEKVTGENAANAANADFLHAIRTYRPSQKIRSLVAMNPRGYHGAQFIDPNYMWVGLGK